MARRPDNRRTARRDDDEEMFDDELDDLDDLDADEGDLDSPVPRGGDILMPERVGVVSGVFRVVTLLIGSLIVFGLLGAVVVIAGRLLGVLPSAASSAALEDPSGIVYLPTASPAGTGDDANCAAGQQWWTTVRSEVDLFAGAMGSPYSLPPADQAQPLIDDLNIRKNAVEAGAVVGCVIPMRLPLIIGMQAVIDGVVQGAAGDTNGFTRNTETAGRQFGEMYAALWERSVITSTDAPVANGVARGGGAGCTVNDWYTSQIKPPLDQFNALMAQTDPRAVAGGALRRVISELEAQRNAVRGAAPPACAAQAQEVLAQALDAYISAYERAGNGDFPGMNTKFAEAGRGVFLFRAWLGWLGLIL